MTSMQAVSGAGRSPGVLALDIIDNVIPYIAKEEEKVEKETKKILGSSRGDGIARREDRGLVHLHARQRHRGAHRVGVRRAQEEGGRR